MTTQQRPDQTTSRAPLSRVVGDRAAQLREDPELMPRLLADPATRVLVVNNASVPLADADAPVLHLATVAETGLDAAAFTGYLGRDASGTHVLLAAVRDQAEFPSPGGWGEMRLVGGELSPEHADLGVTGVALARWHRVGGFCPACGAAAELRQAGWSRECTGCGRQHFPRTDPAVIVAITDDQDRILLGNNALWPKSTYSLFAGFVEAGESLEAAVVRETYEEAGVTVVDIEYAASQAWPYPQSLMVGFFARAASAEAAQADGTEILTVRWFSREDLDDAIAGRGDIRIPASASVARALIDQWHSGGSRL
ncbi:MAG: NAD(+) diphosphatase [Microthrixaceae bacterium]|nr:NAD(+) diphosphatase [Microthrixaceae bacterium]